MGRRISDRTKQDRGMGRGSMENYKPYIEVREFNSRGTTSIIRDWKTGRSVHCMSQAEADCYYLLRWDDENIDVREQYPLFGADGTNAETRRIAEQLGIRYPHDEKHVMTTDFLVTKTGGRMEAYSVKASGELSKRERERLRIEEEYWRARGVPFNMLYHTDVNPVLVDNIRLAVHYYDETGVRDRYGMIRHRIATKEYAADMEHGILDCAALDAVKTANERGLAGV